jgi:pimeloyl-ACP methyl ester carboxylesterase
MKKTTDAIWREDFCEAAGYRQFFRDWQPRTESCLPVLALHGSLTQSGMWRDLAERAHSIRMLCPDQRGFGRSDDPGIDTCAEFARDAAAVADALLPNRYAVMGHSFACSIALELARSEPSNVAAVVLVDPVVRVGATPSASPAATQPHMFASLEEAERHFETTEEGRWTPESLRRFTADVTIGDSVSGAWRLPYAPERLRRLRGFTASPASDYDLFAKAREVRCPVLIFRGGVSKRFPEAAESALLTAFPPEAGATIVLCPDSGHFPASTEPDRVIDALLPFLEGLPKDP